jgi:hypothetical protein
LINTEGIAFPLTTDNRLLGTIQNTFRTGTTASILPTVYSAGNSAIKTEIVEGGALYTTIIVQESTNSNPNSPTFGAYYGTSNISPVFVGFYANQGVNTLMDTGSIYEPFLFPLITGSDPNLGNVREIGGGGLAFFNNATGQTTSASIPYEETLLPLQINDFIRFGDTGSSSSSSLDGSFEALGLYQIQNINIALTASDSSSLNIQPALNSVTQQVTTWGFGESNQTYRIFRRVPNEAFVLIKNLPQYTDPGFLIPEDFNPNFNPFELAKKAGVIS